MQAFTTKYQALLHSNGIVILIALCVLSVVGYLTYIFILYRKNHHKELHFLTIQFPEIDEGKEDFYLGKMAAVFTTLYKLVLTQTDKLSLEIYKTGEYITMQVGSNNNHILEQTKVSFSHIDHAQIRNTTTDELKTITPLFARSISMSKEFYTIAKNEDFFNSIVHFLSSLQKDEHAGMQLILRGVNKKLSIHEKMNGIIYKGKREKRNLTELETTLLHMYQTKQTENLFKAKLTIVANERRMLSNMASLFQALNFSTNTFSSHNDGARNASERFIAPETILSTLPLLKGREGVYLTASELSYLFHPTSVTRGIYAPKQTKVLEASPEFLKDTNDSLFIGTAEDQEGILRKIFLPIEKLTRHLYIVGKTGKGKSTLLTSLVNPLIEKEQVNVFVVDPHDETTKSIIKTTQNTKNIVYLDSTDEERIFTFHPLFGYKKSDNAKAAMRDGALDIIQNETQELGGVSNSGIATINRIKQMVDIVVTFPDAYYTCLVNRKKVSPERAEQLVHERLLTLNDLPLLLIKEMGYFDMLEEVFKDQETEVGLYIARMFENHTKQAMVAEAVQTRLEQLLHPSLRLIYEGNTFNIEEAIKGNKTFLLPVQETVFGSRGSRALMQSLFLLIWQYKRGTKSEERIPTYVFIDEFQRAQIKDIPEIIAEGRKYKLSLIISNQQLGQLIEQIKDALLGNVGTLISFTVAADLIGAKTLAPYFGSNVSEKDLTMLPAYTAYIKTEGDSQKPVATFSFETMPMEEKVGDESMEAIIKRSLATYGENIADLKSRLIKKQKDPMRYFLEDL